MLLILLVLLSLLQTSAECPNACSAHGRCGAYDMCSCYRNWMGNDCSQRICQFGLAHVDSPKGDLDGSKGYLSGPDKIVAVNDFLYPLGTTEKYPTTTTIDGQVLTNTAHEYRECSNKGYCDRLTGTCDCFLGYEGAACQRQSCPTFSDKECSGHGSCLSASEIAELDSGNVYKLWDESVSMGCVCDPGYDGPACERRVCKKGFDPLYFADGPRRYANWSYVLFTKTPTSSISGNYSIIFYDSFGDDWHSAPINYDADCVSIIKALERLPNDVIKAGSVRCLKWDDYQGISANDEPISFSPNPYFGVKYTLTFTQNPGNLKQIEIDMYLDGKRPTLFSDESNNPVGVFVYANGFSGEEEDFFAHRCVGVDVSLSDYADGVEYYNYFSDLTPLEVRLLAKCLGDADGDKDNDAATGRVQGEDYSWDHGSLYNPHIVRLVDISINPVTDICGAEYNSKRGSGVVCPYAFSQPPSSFYAPLYYDPAKNLFVLFTKPSQDYNILTKFAVYTTSGVLQMVSEMSAVITDPQQPYASTVYLTNTSLGLLNGTFDGDISCETTSVNVHGALDCVEKGDKVFLFDPSKSAHAIGSNPAYPNLYEVKRTGKRNRGQYLSYSLPYNELVLDKSITSAWDVSVGDRARVYLFKPSADSTYRQVAECANRGNCDEEGGTCACFPGFESDDCSVMTNYMV